MKEQLAKTKGGKRTSPYTVEYNKGGFRAIMVWTDENGNWPTTPEATGGSERMAVAAADGYVQGCPYGTLDRWFCFYEHQSFGGRRLQFLGCGTQYLTNYNFNDQATGWVNTSKVRDIDVYNHFASGGYVSGHLWTMTLWAQNGNVGSADNDKASAFRHNC